MKKQYCIISILSLLIFYTATPLFADKLIPADNPQINYYGRFDFSTPSVAKFNWSGSTIEASFSGSVIGVSLKDGHNNYDYFIDSIPYDMLVTKIGTAKYILSDNLSNTSHTIRISQRNESHEFVSSFMGFYVADNGQLLSAPEKPKRKIEFIGDSWIAGYGNESPKKSCTDESLREYTNTNRSFPTLITNAFKAQSMILGFSGQGIIHNWNTNSKKAPDPYPFYYNKILGKIKNSGIWDFSQWIPDVVILCLGINDFFRKPHPDDTMFINGYHAFLDTIINHYSEDIPIICVSAHTDSAGPMKDGMKKMDACIKKAVQEEINVYGRKNVYYFETPEEMGLNGCYYHPDVAEDSLIAKKLIGEISEVTGWNTENNSGIHKQMLYKDTDRFSIRRSGGIIHFIMSYQVQPAEVYITNLSGIVIKQGMIGVNRNFAWNTENVPPGIYLLNCAKLNVSKKILIKRGK
ncbi:MAG: GDSL-type esterase/lipase family protein [Chitinispirillia bacterium]